MTYFPLQHRTAETNGIRLHVAEMGEGPAVVLCHGFPETWYAWRHQLPALAGRWVPRAGAGHARLWPERSAGADRGLYTA